MVDCVGLDKLTRCAYVRPSGVVSTYPLLPSAVKAVVTAQYAPDATETNSYAKNGVQMMPDDFGTPLELVTYGKDTIDDVIWD